MNISFSNKFVFISCHKTGSSSIREALRPYSDIASSPIGGKPPYNYHTTAKELKLHLEKLNRTMHKWDDFFTFTIVRNPWDAQVSLWKYMERVSAGPYASHPDQKKYIKTINKFKNFENWTKNHGISNWSHWYQNEHGENLLSYIGKFENLQEDFNTICDKIGIPQQQLPHKNATKHKHYSEYYDDETRQIVAERHAKEIEYFGYKFGE
jgi:hypothetical protein